tara:strand:+ start:182 stop:1276 length:1095 start_codon:yes stop_codon:yes gene_type:complete
MLPIFEPYLDKNEIKKLVNKCIDSNWISSQGSNIKKLESNISKYHKSKYALVTSSCTSALHLALLSLNLKHHDEVICPALTFISPANMILLSGLKIVLADINLETLTLDINDLKKKITNKTRAIIVVHQFGHSAEMDEISKICKKYKIKIIEDNAESLGGYYKNKMLGTIGDVATLSFFGNKIITTGEGGAIITNNKRIYQSCLVMRDHGMSLKKKYDHRMIGFNYRMTNLQAAVGMSQFKKLPKILKIRNKQMKLYYSLLSNNENFALRGFKNWCTPVHWLMTLILRDKKNKNKIIKFLKENNIEARPMINPVNRARHFRYIKNKFLNAEFISERSIHLPSSTNLKEINIERISKVILSFFDQ